MKTIKTSVIIALLVMISSLAMAQTEVNESTDSKHELSIVIDDIFAPEVVAIQPIYNDPYVVYYSDFAMLDKYTTKIGLGYKFHFGENALRTKFSVGIGNENMDEDYDQDSDYDYSIESKNSMIKAFLGYERNITFGKAQVFFGFDFNFTKYTSDVTTEEKYTYDDYKIIRTNSYQGIGLSPLLGVRYYITPKFSLSTEVKYQVESYNGESTRKYNDNPEYKEKVNGLYTKFGPLGSLSVNIHF